MTKMSWWGGWQVAFTQHVQPLDFLKLGLKVNK